MLLFEESKNNKSLLTKFEKMLKTNEVYFFDSHEFEDIVSAYLDKGDTLLAKRALDFGFEQYPNSIDLKVVYADYLIYCDKFKEAEIIVNDLLELDPNNRNLFLQKALIASRKQKRTMAISLLKKAVEISSSKKKVELLNLIGIEYLHKNEIKNALVNFQKCLELDPNNRNALDNIVMCYESLKDYEKAIEFLEKIIDTDPFNEGAWFNLGLQRLKIEDLDKAIAAFDYAILIDETYLNAYKKKGQCLLKLGSHEDALKTFAIILKLEDPPTSLTCIDIGECYKNLKDFKMAQAYIKRAVNNDPLMTKGWISLSGLFALKKDFYSAHKYIKSVVEIEGDNPEIWKKYGDYSMEIRNYSDAEFGYKNCLKYSKVESEEIWFKWVDTFLLNQNYDTYLSHLLRRGKLKKNDPNIHFRLSIAYYKLMNDTQGERNLKIGLELEYQKIHIIEQLAPSLFEQNIIQEHLI